MPHMQRLTWDGIAIHAGSLPGYPASAGCVRVPVEFAEMGRLVDEASAHRPVVHATGQPGDMFLVHPFTVHAADEHRGRTPRFMAQGPVVLTSPLTPASSSPLARVWEN